MAQTRQKSSSGSKMVKSVSNDWKEIYVDSALIAIDDYATRITFVNHRPDFEKEGIIVESRVVDIIMSKKTLIELSEIFSSIVKEIKEEEGDHEE